MSSILLFVFLFCMPVFSALPEVSDVNQKKMTVHGVVLDESNEPLIGVSVQIKGTTQGTVTDLDGKYSVSAPSDGTLVFTFVGMDKQEIPVKGRSNIMVTMRSNTIALSDVVVIGYGKQSKAALTSAITKIDSKDMAISPSGNPMSMLQGKVPGMEIRVNSGQPGADPQIIVRGGTTTAPEGDSPMVIIDGVIHRVKQSIFKRCAKITQPC